MQLLLASLLMLLAIVSWSQFIAIDFDYINYRCKTKHQFIKKVLNSMRKQKKNPKNISLRKARYLKS